MDDNQSSGILNLTPKASAIWLFIAMVVVVCVGALVGIYAYTWSENDKKVNITDSELVDALRNHAPNIAASEIHDSLVPGVKEVFYRNQLRYVIDGRYIVQGPLFDLKTGENLSAISIAGYQEKQKTGTIKQLLETDQTQSISKAAPKTNNPKAAPKATTPTELKSDPKMDKVNVPPVSADSGSVTNKLEAGTQTKPVSESAAPEIDIESSRPLGYRALIMGVQKKLGRQLTEKEVMTIIRSSVANSGLPDKMTVKYPAVGEEQIKLTVFSDITCPFCQQLHTGVPELQKMGVTVRYLLFPRKGLEAPEAEIMAKIACYDTDAKRMAALDRAFNGDTLPEMEACNMEGIKANYVLTGPGTSGFDITGTPTILASNGIRLDAIPTVNKKLDIDALKNALLLE